VSVISVHFPPSLRWNNGQKPNMLPPTRRNVKLGCWVCRQSSNRDPILHLSPVYTFQKRKKKITSCKGPSTRVRFLVQIAVRYCARFAYNGFGFWLSFGHQLQLRVNKYQDKSVEIVNHEQEILPQLICMQNRTCRRSLNVPQVLFWCDNLGRDSPSFKNNF
jgi:hypothetical protein